MKELEERISKNGSINLSRTLTKGITPMNELVLSRLRTERDYAVLNNYITEDGFFIADEEELSYHTGLSEDAIRNVISNLEIRKFVDVKKVQESYLICINDKQIIRIIDELETDEPEYFGNWDKNLKKVQKEILKLDIKKENNNDITTGTDNKDSKLKMPPSIKRDSSKNTQAVSELESENNT